MRRDTILFDINETVLDLSTLKPNFQRVFGDESALAIWFSMLLHSSTVCIVTGVKTNFATLSADMLDAVAGRLGIYLSDLDRTDILSGFANLQPHADIKSSLTRLQNAGYQTIAFSNSSLQLSTTQIKNADLTDYFNRIISVEETGSFKPNIAVYQFVARQVNRPIQDLRLVTTHDWDTHGALTAGMQGAYIDRSGAPYHPLYIRPDIVEDNMSDLVNQIIHKDKKTIK